MGSRTSAPSFPAAIVTLRENRARFQRRRPSEALWEWRLLKCGSCSSTTKKGLEHRPIASCRVTYQRGSVVLEFHEIRD